jgi:hypothetical protein
MKFLWGMLIVFGVVGVAGYALGFEVARLFGFFETEQPNENLGPLTDD